MGWHVARSCAAIIWYAVIVYCIVILHLSQ